MHDLKEIKELSYPSCYHIRSPISSNHYAALHFIIEFSKASKFFDALEGLNWQLMVGSASLTILIAHFLDGNSQYLQHQLGHLNAAGNCHLHAVHHLVALKQRVMFDLKEKLWSNYIPKLTRMLTYNLNKL